MNEVFAGFLEHADAQIGRLIEFLQLSGKLDNTVLIMCSDNGAAQSGGESGTLNIGKYVNGIPENAADIMPHLGELGGPLHYNNYPRGWAMVGNTPGRRYKNNTHGGGVRVPMIIHFEREISPGSVPRRQFHHAVDVVPTILDVLGLALPNIVRGHPQMPLHGKSMRYSFKDFERSTSKRLQYFEMFGHRGIWADGWKAVTFHPKGVPFDQDVWELYHLDEDFSECTDLAAEEPERLRRLISLWWNEAGRYNVLPLDDRGVERLALHKGGQPERLEFTYFPGVSRVNPNTAPDLRDRDWRISAEVRTLPHLESGVLLAMGGRHSGIALYLEEAKPVFTYNAYGDEHTLVSDTPLSTEEWSLVEVAFARTGPNQGYPSIALNGKVIAAGPVVETIPRYMGFEGLDVGRDSLTAVSSRYEAPFAFLGELRKVTIQLEQRESKCRGEIEAGVELQ